MGLTAFFTRFLTSFPLLVQLLSSLGLSNLSALGIIRAAVSFSLRFTADRTTNHGNPRHRVGAPRGHAAAGPRPRVGRGGFRLSAAS
jgi:hypothetical protein